MEDLHKTIFKPSIATKHINRVNYSIDSVEDYFGITVCKPFLDFIIIDINARFTEGTLN